MINANFMPIFLINYLKFNIDMNELSKSTIRSSFIKNWGGDGAQDRVSYAFNEIRQTLDDF